MTRVEKRLKARWGKGPYADHVDGWQSIGPFRFSAACQIVVGPAGEKILTPMLANLLGAFISSPSQVLTPDQLYRGVWHTDWAGDLRTLQTHICWLRQAIEPDPAHPRYLLTCGQGYRFEPDQIGGPLAPSGDAPRAPIEARKF